MRKFFVASLATILFVVIAGCGTAPRPTAAPTLAPVIITQIVTATPPPVTDTPAPSVAATTSITSTSGITTTQTTIAQARPSNTTAGVRSSATSTRRPATVTPTKAGTVVPTGIPIAIKYPQAIKLIGPVYVGNGPGDRRDEQHYGDALVFEWYSNGGLGEGECYLVRVDAQSNANQSKVGDSFMQCDSAETSKNAAQTTRFILNKPNGPGPTYAALMPSGGGDLSITWAVTVAKDEGAAANAFAYFPRDASRHNVTLLSPRSEVFYFPFKGAP